jgi:hypothetical protein
MPDFKGRKDFPEVADAKIKIGDYSGNNRLAVTDIYSPKAEPELRDQIMESRKGKPNNYDSPVLSQQPVITLSDMDAEAALIRAIGGYVEKQAGLMPVKPEPTKMPNAQEAAAARGGQRQAGMPAPETSDSGGSGGSPQGFKPSSPTAAPTKVFGGRVAGEAPAQNTAPSAPIKPAGTGAYRPIISGGGNTAQKPPTRPPANSGDGYTAEQQRNAMNPRNTVTIPQTPRQPAGGGGAPQKTTPGPGFDEGRGKRGKKGRGVSGFFGDLAGAAKVGVQQGIRSGKEGAYEEGAEADERRGVQRGKTNKNRSTRVASSLARSASKLPGMRRGAKAMGFGRTKAEEDAMRTRMEYAGDEEMALSDILNELESYIANEQPNNSMVERQMTKGNISKMMRNTEEKAPKDWKYHV